MVHRRRALVPAALLVALLVLPAGCGEDKPEGVPPRSWARQVCGGLSGWQGGLTEASNRLREARTGDLETARATLVSFLDDITSRTDRLLQVVTDAGKPAVDEGDAMSRDFRQAVRDVASGFAQSRERTRALPTGDAVAFQAGLARIVTDLRNAQQQLKDRLDQVQEDYDSPELVKALETEPACAGVYHPSTVR